MPWRTFFGKKMLQGGIHWDHKTVFLVNLFFKAAAHSGHLYMSQSLLTLFELVLICHILA